MSLPTFYEHYCPTKIVAGQLALSNLSFEMQRLGVNRALLVADHDTAGSLALARIRQAYRDSGARLSEFHSNAARPTLGQAREIAERYRRENCDCLVALGSENAMDLAKAAAILSRGLNPADVAGRDKLTSELPRLLAVPTGYCPGQQVSSFCRTLDEASGQTSFIVSERLYPHLVVIDPLNCSKADRRQVLHYGLEALSLAVQAYLYSSNPVVEIYARAAIELVRKYLLRAVGDPTEREAAQALANANLYAGIAFSATATGPLAALSDAHQCRELHAVLLPLLLAFEAGRSPERLLELTEVLGGSRTHLNAASQVLVPVELVQKLCCDAAAAAGAVLDLATLGLNAAETENLAAAALTSPFAGDACADDLLAILRQA